MRLCVNINYENYEKKQTRSYGVISIALNECLKFEFNNESKSVEAPLLYVVNLIGGHKPVIQLL